MKDLVDRQDAMDAFGLSEKTRKYGGDHSGYGTMMLYEIQDTLEDLPSVQSEQQWIPVSERLPEKPKGYPKSEIRRSYFLVSLESGCVKTLGYEFDREEWQITGSPVTAWMPLPEPYTPERKAATQLTTVDAIPVEWIQKQIDAEPKWSEKGMYYAELLMDWAERREEC